ncbi:glycosyltransferase family 2 protein [Ruegeria sp. AU67]|uniref:glycosyltransferase n=1 Tax=Ruegeria sp. AU67 TaxID=2108530 RepID=UPI0013598FAD|nr:glycosyltransferase family A protein [Ruegeria sp. AU67]
MSIIIPTFRDTAGLRSTLDALSQQSYPKELTEILCIDNTPDFELCDQAASLFPARLLHEPRPGSYAARNRGLAEATGEVFAFTDAACVPEPNWITSGIAELERHPTGALVAGKIQVFAEDPKKPTAVEILQIHTAFPQETYATRNHFGATANVFVSRGVIEKAGPFLGTLLSGGDHEFGRRVHASGFPVVYGETVVIRHPARRHLKAALSKSRRVVKGVYVMEKRGRLPHGHFRRGLYRDLRPPVLTCWALLTSPLPGGITRRLRAAGAMVFLRYYRAAYRLKIMAGSKQNKR